MSDNTMICNHCTYAWQTRVASPKSCPRCKRRFDYQEAKIVLRRLSKQFGYRLTGDIDG
ncbi:MAG: hypothetical protein GXP63_07110 [DPANN group archaeon]|nr:hypothetical protein [DPANN group archaeon]